MLVGFAYNLLQIPPAIYYLKTGKSLINYYGFFLFDLYGDKVSFFFFRVTLSIKQLVGMVLRVSTLALPLPRSETNILSNSFIHLQQLGLLLLATSTGAAFGATLEIKRSADNLETINRSDASDYRSKIGDFSTMAYLSAGILVIAFVSSAVSSIISSLALSRKG